MAESNDNFSLFNRDDVQGLVTEHVVKNLRIAPYLDIHNAGDNENYVFDTIDSTAETDMTNGILQNPIPQAPGGKLDVIRMSGMTPNAQPILMSGFQYEVETAKIEKRPYTIEYFLKRMAYAIGKTIEYDVITKLEAKAAAGTASLTNSVWSESNAIDQDILKMQKEFADDSLPDVLTGAFYDVTNLQELKLFKRATEGAGEGWGDANSVPWLGTEHIYGGSQMTHGHSIGFDLNNPPAVVAYGTEPGAFNPQVLSGMEGYAPIINVKVKQVEDEMPRVTKIFMAAKYTVAVLEPYALQKQTGL